MNDFDEEYRNDYGLPVTATVPHNRGNFHQSVDNSVNKALPWIATCCLLTGISIAIAVWAMIDTSRTEREARMLQYYILELDGKLMNQGLIDPSRSLSAKRQKETEK